MKQPPDPTGKISKHQERRLNPTMTNEGLPTASEVVVAARGLTKCFGTNRVLHGIDLDIRGGEVLVLLGPNGAGKSTFLNIIGGTLKPTSGSVALCGQPLDLATYGSSEARAGGIKRVFQELSTFSNLSVAENLALTSRRGVTGSTRAMAETADGRMAAFPENGIVVTEPVGGLSIAERQMVEIVRAMTEPDTRLVILDEPTSALSAHEAGQLGDLIREKAAQGTAIVYVTHKLEEALRLADRIVVLRDGRVHFDGDGRNRTQDELLDLLGAASQPQERVSEPFAGSARSRLLTVDKLRAGRLRDVDLHVCEGEIVGIAGLEGAGQRDLLQAVFAARGRKVDSITSTTDIAYVTGDRKAEGLLPLWDVERNVGISAVPRNARAGVVDFDAVRATAQHWLAELGLSHRAASPIVSLSGGNQQRALLGRALASEAPLLLLDDPTRGVDAAAKVSIYDTLHTVKEAGRSAILFSTEVSEFAMCDRVYVMARGCVVAEFSGADVTQEQIVQASFAQPDATGHRGDPSENSAPSRVRNVLSGSLRSQIMPAALLMLAMFGLTFSQAPNALSTFGLDILLQASVPLAFAIIAQMLFMQAGDLDLGLGFAIGLANTIAATYLADAPAIAVLALGGLVAGYVLLAVLVERLTISSVVATLGASFVWLGLGLIVRESPGGRSPEWLSAMVQVKLWPLPLACYVLVAVAALGTWLCRGWSYSILLRAFGHNRDTYVSLGFSALAARATLYALAAMFAILAGLFLTATTGAGNVHIASNFTLATIAAAVVGGASFAGGRVEPIGAVMAVIGISLISTNLGFLGISAEYSTAISGLALIAALSFRPAARQSAS